MKTSLVVLSLATFGLAGCGDGNGDVSPDVFKQALIAQGLDEEVSECVTNRLSDSLSEDDFSKVALAQDLADLDDDLEAIAMNEITVCVTGG